MAKKHKKKPTQRPAETRTPKSSPETTTATDTAQPSSAAPRWQAPWTVALWSVLVQGVFLATSPLRSLPISAYFYGDALRYLETARRLAEKRGLRVGWQEVRAEENLRFDVMRSSRPGRRLLD